MLNDTISVDNGVARVSCVFFDDGLEALQNWAQDNGYKVYDIVVDDATFEYSQVSLRFE